MNLKDMQDISERYLKIKEANEDIDDMHVITEHLLENKCSAWASIDIPEQGDNTQATNWTATSTIIQYLSEQPKTKGFSVEIPDTIALEIIGILIRNKQQQIKELINDNNIQKH